ncbi:MAG: hypothetical protein LBI19_08285 [Oscillospiraceae bacterium]|jgi:hypothetical protein|nr:hypothetical protein [Oscillospiraceae bacterium]
MKRIIFGILSIALLLSACTISQQLEDDFEIKEVVAIQGDRMIYQSLQQLLEPADWGGTALEDFSADLVVIGEFMAETESKLIYEYSDHFGRDIVADTLALNQFYVTEVLKGDVKIGDTVTITQRYSFDEERGAFILFGELTPMHKGDRWIYFLKFSAHTGAYYPVGEADGRYPVPNDELMRLAKEAIAGMNAREEWFKSREIMKSETVGAEEWWYVPDRSGKYYRVTQSEAEEFDSFLTVTNNILENIESSAFGVLDRHRFKYLLYAEILDHFNIEAQDWVNPGRDFDAKLIGVHERQ